MDRPAADQRFAHDDPRADRDDVPVGACARGAEREGDHDPPWRCGQPDGEPRVPEPPGGGCVRRWMAVRRGAAAPPLLARRDSRCRERARVVSAPFLYAGVALCLIGGPRAAQAQSRAIAAADSSARPEREGNVLSRLVSVDFDDLPLGLALHLIAQEGRLRLSYSSDVVPVSRRVSVSRQRTPVGEVLRDVLAGTSVDPIVTPSGYVVLVRNPRATLVANGALPDSALPNVERTAIRAQAMDRVLVMGTPAAGAPERE